MISKVPSVSLALLLAALTMSCKKEAHTDATQPLQQSFQSAEPEIKQVIVTFDNNIKAGNYAEATRALAPIASRPNLDQAQRQALGAALSEINKAVAANPALDTKEMYDMRARMFQAVHGGNRF